MDVLIAGGGIAGLTLAALLRPAGHQVTVVDPHGAEPHASQDGYALALWPHGTRVLHAIGVHDQVVAKSLPMRRYTARSGTGVDLAASPLPAPIVRQGHLGIVSRRDLIDLLTDAGRGVEHRAGRIAGLTQHPGRVEALLHDGSHLSADLLVAADGIGSAVRTALLGPQPRLDTGWTCATWWTSHQYTDRLRAKAGGETVEFWGAGSFVGLYPCPGRVCVIVGGPTRTIHSPHRQAWLHRTLTDAGLPASQLLPTIAGEPWLWPMTDVQAARWVHDRVALVGDAAAAFLPTAGVGASMALGSAAALADELTRCDTAHVPTALRLYERRRKRRVERAQRQSRVLARVLFTTSPLLARLRNAAVARTPVDRLLGPLVRDLEHPI